MPGRQVLEVEVVTDGTEPGWLSLAIAPEGNKSAGNCLVDPSFAAPPEAAPPDWPLGGKYRLSACTGTAPRRWVVTVRANGATQGYVEYELFARLQVAAPRLTEGEATVGASLLRDGVDGFALGWSYFFVRVPPAAEVHVELSTLQSELSAAGVAYGTSAFSLIVGEAPVLAAAACAELSGVVGGGELPANSSLASHVEVSDSFVRSYQSEAQRQFYAATLTAPPTPQPSADCADSTAGGGGRALYVAVRGSAELPDAGLRFRLQVDVRAPELVLDSPTPRYVAVRQRPGYAVFRTKIPSDKVLTVRADVATNPEGLP